MTLGRLLDLEVVTSQGVRHIKPRTTWLATDGHGKSLVLCQVRKKATVRISGQVASLHKRFHRAESRGAWEGFTPDPHGKLRTIGLLRSLVYKVPPGSIKSPEKNPYHWHHKFGDTGHKGGTYPSYLYPAVQIDQKGNIFIVRRSGNIFKTSDWVRG